MVIARISRMLVIVFVRIRCWLLRLVTELLGVGHRGGALPGGRSGHLLAPGLHRLLLLLPVLLDILGIHLLVLPPPVLVPSPILAVPHHPVLLLLLLLRPELPLRVEGPALAGVVSRPLRQVVIVLVSLTLLSPKGGSAPLAESSSRLVISLPPVILRPGRAVPVLGPVVILSF